jgi:hypothetical protein
MKSIEIDIDNIKNAGELALQFEEYNLQEGDNLILKSDKTTLIFGVIVIAIVVLALVIYYEKGQAYANEVLLQVLGDGDIHEIERGIENEFGISIDLETKEREDWYELSGGQLLNAYSETEPDYDLSMLKEPNPEYKK